MSMVRHTPADERFFLARSLAASMRDGDAVTAHSHRWGQLIYVASGVVTVTTAEGTWVAPPHWAVWAAPNVAHGFRASGATALQTVYVRPTLRALPQVSGVVAVSPLLREVITAVVAVGMLDRRTPTHLALATLLRAELTIVQAPAIDLPWPSAERLRRVAEHLVSTPRARESHAALARRCGLSLRSLERGFARETGMALGRWTRQARFQFALERVGAGVAVKVAADEAGYATPSAFVAAFRAVFGTTPGRYFRGR
jgi:AraC-like DNA-binding protein